MNLEQIAQEIKQTRKDCAWIAEGMPMFYITDGQKALNAKSGTPYKFALGCIECIGDISILEAQQAAEKYKREWEVA